MLFVIDRYANSGVHYHHMYWFLINHSNKLKQIQHKVGGLQVRSMYSFRVGLRVAWWRKLKVSHPAQKPHLFRLIIGGSSYFGVGARGRRKLNDSRNNRTGKCPSESKGVTSFFDKIWHKSVCGGCGCGGGQATSSPYVLRQTGSAYQHARYEQVCVSGWTTDPIPPAAPTLPCPPSGEPGVGQHTILSFGNPPNTTSWHLELYRGRKTPRSRKSDFENQFRNRCV